jgi:RNA-directed DNA polymerase
MSMNADEKSDEGIGPMKQPNKGGSPSAEAVEGRTSPEGNGGKTTAARTLRRDTASSGLDAVRRAARLSKSVRFTALLHHITVDLLTRSYFALERDSAPGIDGVTWQAYGEDLEEKLTRLHDRIHKGSYRARPSRRTYIPKASQAQGDQGGAAQVYARPHREDRSMGAAVAARASELLCGVGQSPEPVVVLQPGAVTLA